MPQGETACRTRRTASPQVNRASLVNLPPNADATRTDVVGGKLTSETRFTCGEVDRGAIPVGFGRAFGG